MVVCLALRQVEVHLEKKARRRECELARQRQAGRTAVNAPRTDRSPPFHRCSAQQLYGRDQRKAISTSLAKRCARLRRRSS
jgi:hypothetical protein